MYLFLQYPENIYPIFNEGFSEYQIAPKPTNGEAVYTIEFSQKIETSDPSDIKIVEKAEGYILSIADKDRDVISQYNDVKDFADNANWVKKTKKPLGRNKRDFL